MIDGLARQAGCAYAQLQEIVEDQIPEPPDEAVTKPGDLIVMGNHRLLCGDSANPQHVDRLLDGAEIHLVNTDPPYNVKVEPRSDEVVVLMLDGWNRSAGVREEVRLARELGKPVRYIDPCAVI